KPDCLSPATVRKRSSTGVGSGACRAVSKQRIHRRLVVKSLIRVRMSSREAHYGGMLVDGARILELFGDVATELCIRADGDEGLFRAYESVEFLKPVLVGDYIEAEGEIVGWGRTSLRMEFVARRVIALSPDAGPS